jgi:predicted metal-dependent hydrolase
VPGRGLEVVLPLHADPACVPLVLARYKGWIEKNLRRLSPPSGHSSGVLPESLLLKGGCEIVEIFREGAAVPAKGNGQAEEKSAEKRGRPAPPGSFSPPTPVRPRRLELPDAPANHLLPLLKEWVREEARAYLAPLLQTLALEHGFSYSGLHIRFQKSRWGSCSAKGGINLNACLLFLPEPLTRYILLHELCHTRQMNHSAAFWKLIFALDPEALAKDRAMRNAWKHVPDWLLKAR